MDDKYPITPKSWNADSKPHLFCPGCGHGIVLKHLGYVIDDLAIKRRVTLGIDIGCSLLAWDFFNCDTVQTHHGRTTSVMVGYKKVKPKRIALAYMGDGGGYAIGLQSLLHAAYRNDPITVILVNNENYAMTGGQMAPTTPVGMITSTSPLGKEARFGPGFRGPELIRQIADKNAYIARGTVANPIELANMIKSAITNQTNHQSFSFIEVLSICPTNWKTNIKESMQKLKEMAKIYPIGEITEGAES